MARSAPGEEQSPLQSTDVHEVLKNKRRRMALELLREAENGMVSVRGLTERIADEETNESPAPRAKRQSVVRVAPPVPPPKTRRLRCH